MIGVSVWPSLLTLCSSFAPTKSRETESIFYLTLVLTSNGITNGKESLTSTPLLTR